MNFNAATLTELVRTAQPDVLEGPDGHLDDADCELLLQRLLNASRDEEETTSRSGTRWRWLAAGGSLVGAAAAVLILALVAVGGHNPGPSSIHHDEPLPTQVQTVAEISANTSHAVLTAFTSWNSSSHVDDHRHQWSNRSDHEIVVGPVQSPGRPRNCGPRWKPRNGDGPGLIGNGQGDLL